MSAQFASQWRPNAVSWSRTAALIVTLVVTGACSGSNSYSSKGASTTTTAPEHVRLGSQDVIVRGRQAVSGTANVEIADNYFQPNVLSAAGGATITITLSSTAQALHNFSAPEIDHDIPPGQTFSATVRVPASGELLFFCKYHRDEAGMVGVVTAT